MVGDAAILSEKCAAIKKELVAAVNGGQGEHALSAALDKARAIPNFKNKVRTTLRTGPISLYERHEDTMACGSCMVLFVTLLVFRWWRTPRARWR